MLEPMPADGFDPSNLPEGPVPVLFWATWCGYCPRVRKALEEHAATSDRPFYAVDISDEESPVWDDHHIQVVPTVVLFEDGEPRGRVAGILAGPDLDQLLEGL